MNAPPPPDEPTRLKLNAPRILAGTMAAVTGAALSSRLGLAGTLVGTAVISLVSGTAATVYEHSVVRGRAAMRSRIAALEAGHTRQLHHQRRWVRRLGSPRRWALAGAGALATFVLALGLITAIEVVHGRSLSGSGHATTLGEAFTNHSSGHQRPRQPAPSATPSSTTPARPARAQPTQTPSATRPPGSTPTAPTPTPTTRAPAPAPTTQTPTETPTTPAPTETTPSPTPSR